jgi:hypothetical protein
MRIKARLAISDSMLIMKKGGKKPARRRLQRLVRRNHLANCGSVDMSATDALARLGKFTR